MTDDRKNSKKFQIVEHHSNFDFTNFHSFNIETLAVNELNVAPPCNGDLN